MWFKLAASPRKTTQIRDVISNKLDVLGTNITPAQTAEAQSTRRLAHEAICGNEYQACSSMAVRLHFHATGLSICLYMAADLRDLKPLTCERRPTSEANLLFLGLRMRCGVAKDVRDERFFRVASQCSARRYLLAVREPAMGRPQ